MNITGFRHRCPGFSFLKALTTLSLKSFASISFWLSAMPDFLVFSG